MEKYNWTLLNHLQLGKYAEYYAKMEFTLYGFCVYTSEVDDRGIDFIIKKDNQYFDIQVKSVRNNNYIFLQKEKFKIRENLIAAVILFNQLSPPELYLIPSIEWENPNGLLISRDYIDKKSKPEWGLSITKKNKILLEKYSFSKIIEQLK